MASRRLALNLAQGIRSRAGVAAVRPLQRGFATPVTSPLGAKTQSTTLKNGLTVSCSPPTNWSQRYVSGPGLTWMDQLRSLPSTRHGRKRRRLVCGLMPDRGPRRTRRMAQHTSWSISPSRYAKVPSEGRSGMLTIVPGHCQAIAASIGAGD
jgi:hypothetical protein